MWTSRSGWHAITALICLAWTGFGVANAQTDRTQAVRSKQIRVGFSCGNDCLWAYGDARAGSMHRIAPPVFEVDGNPVVAYVPRFTPIGSILRLKNGVSIRKFEGPIASDSHLRLLMELQINDETPVVRFRYILKSDNARKLTAGSSHNSLTYLGVSMEGLPNVLEVGLSDFAAQIHSYTLSEQTIRNVSFQRKESLMGPILAASDGHRSFLIAYEHGSPSPDAFLRYDLSPDRRVHLRAVKGNYTANQLIDETHPYQTIWMESAEVQGDVDKLASVFRTFVLNNMSPNEGTRKPYIFYNTWNFQERNKWWNGKAYLDSMNEDRILEEIDVAHRIGVDVFVLDTGWHEKTGDWTVSTKRFPDHLKAVKARLDSYNMKLGLWFGPTSAAVSSRVVREHPEWRMSLDGKIKAPREIWETEKSYEMCMVSGYADTFAEELIRLAKEVGVTYFKWDAIGQYGCNDPHHDHGNESNTAQERTESYGFQLVQAMGRVADKVSAAVPGAIVDFDITEGGRAVGLGWLASGKYFLINNGPYYRNYDVPEPPPNAGTNLFFHQGQSRAWIARSPLVFDKWIPSVLFLTHYFPDDPKQWQEVNAASLILGQNGLWGDLPNISPAGVNFWADVMGRYKRVREDITASDPVETGIVSGSPEVHEKISSVTGKGAIAIFATTPGTYSYVTKNKVQDDHWETDGVSVDRIADGTAEIHAKFERPGAKVIFFGAGTKGE